LGRAGVYTPPVCMTMNLRSINIRILLPQSALKADSQSKLKNSSRGRLNNGKRPEGSVFRGKTPAMDEVWCYMKNEHHFIHEKIAVPPQAPRISRSRL